MYVIVDVNPEPSVIPLKVPPYGFDVVAKSRLPPCGSVPANVITIGARFTDKNLALKCVNTFIKTNFKGGRHLRRVKKI